MSLGEEEMSLHSSFDSSASYTAEEDEHTHLLDTDEDIILPDVDEDMQYHGEIDEDTDMHEEQEQIEGSNSPSIALPDEFEFEHELALSDESSGSIDEDTDMHEEQEQEVYNNTIPVQVPVQELFDSGSDSSSIAQEFFDSGSDSSSIALPDEFEFEEELTRSNASDSDESSGSEAWDRDPDINLECECGEDEISETEETIQLLHELRVSEMPFSNSSDDISDGLQCIDEKKILFFGSALNKLQVVCLLLRMYIRHKISFTEMDSFLKMLNFLLPQPNCLPKTWYRMKKFISAYLPKVRIYKVYNYI